MALWDFMRDIAANMNRRKEGFRFSENFKSIAEAMKVYRGRRICDLFTLNYVGPVIVQSSETPRRAYNIYQVSMGKSL